MGIYFFYGEEDYNIDLELNKMRSALNPDFLSMSCKTLSNPNFENLITALRTPPMMFGSSLTIIDIGKYFFDDKYNFDDKQYAEIEEGLKDNQNGVDIVFLVRTSNTDGKKIDTRRKLYKILSKYNAKEFPTIPSYKTDILSSWINARAKEKDIKISNDAILTLLENVGTNLLQLNAELDKLKLAAYPDKTVTDKMVKDNCITNEDLFNITNYIMKNEKDKAVLEYKQLLNKKHPLEILSALQTMIRQWIIIKAKSASPATEIMNVTGLKEGRIAVLKKSLKNTALKDIVKLKENLFNVEYRIKSGQVLDIDSEVELALIR